MGVMLLSTVLLLGLTQGMALESRGIDSILNSNGMFGGAVGSQSVEGTKDPHEQLTKTLNDPDKLSSMYAQYQSAFGKMGSEDNDSKQKHIFKTNLLKISSHNTKARAGKATYEMGVNQFTDMSLPDVIRNFTGYAPKNKTSKTVKLPMPSASKSKRAGTPPNAIDWRNYGLVTPVKDQGQCGSCVLFSTTGCLESYYALTHGQQNGWLDLSEQELLDCDNGAQYPSNGGCNGNGFPDTFKFLENVGLPLEKDYPYMAKQGQCQTKASVTKVKGHWSVSPSGDENALKSAVGNFGPVSVAFCVTDSFQHYHSGVYTGPCAGNRNHAVLAVGYGSENGMDYWILKNQWSTSWGDQGYIKLGRNMNNLCQISSDAVSCNTDTEIAIG